MFDIQLIRDNLEAVEQALKYKNMTVDLKDLLNDDRMYREKLFALEELRAERNAANLEIKTVIAVRGNPKDQISAMKGLSARVDVLEPQVKELQKNIEARLLALPNLAHESVPVGGEGQNQIIREWGQPAQFDFKPRTHIEIAEHLDIIDFQRSRKVSGAGFIFYKKQGAQLQRALSSLMLDVHTREHGYTEVMPPVLVNRESMTGTGQLPKMEEDMYQLKDDPLFLIPTAEVPVTNLHRDEVLDEESLPIKYCAFSSCFRREAGSYGKDTRGMIRVHQFEKVELVKFVSPEKSYEELDCLVADAETIFKKLELPYRVLLLASGDLSFAAAKCFDIEVHAAGVDAWLEVSSCSNFEDFQARRAGIRCKGAGQKKAAFVHTLNGSGVALARAFVAILENNQTPEGDVLIPRVLQPYMHGAQRITC